MQTDRAVATLATNVRNANLQLNDLSDEMLAYNQRVFNEVSTQTDHDVKTDRNVLLIATIFGLLVGIISISIVKRSVVRPLHTLVGNVEHFGKQVIYSNLL